MIAIDPGSQKSAYVVLGDSLEPVEFDILENEEILKVIDRHIGNGCCAVIENISSYGMSVGAEVFKTCVWVGRFTERIIASGGLVNYIYRKDVKLNLCQSMRAKDGNIITALVDRFAQHDKKRGKGTKGDPDWFYGFKADLWQAYAVGVTYHDMERVKAK